MGVVCLWVRAPLEAKKPCEKSVVVNQYRKQGAVVQMAFDYCEVMPKNKPGADQKGHFKICILEGAYCGEILK